MPFCQPAFVILFTFFFLCVGEKHHVCFFPETAKNITNFAVCCLPFEYVKVIWVVYLAFVVNVWIRFWWTYLIIRGNVNLTESTVLELMFSFCYRTWCFLSVVSATLRYYFLQLPIENEVVLYSLGQVSISCLHQTQDKKN